MDFLPPSIITCPLLGTNSTTFQFSSPSTEDSSGLNLPLLPVNINQDVDEPGLLLSAAPITRLVELIRHLVKFNMVVTPSCTRRLALEFPLQAKEWQGLFQRESRGRAAPSFSGGSRRSWLRDGFIQYEDPRELVPLLGEDWYISHWNHMVSYLHGPVRISLLLRHVSDFQRYNEEGRRLLIIPGSTYTSSATFFTLSCENSTVSRALWERRS